MATARSRPRTARPCSDERVNTALRGPRRAATVLLSLALLTTLPATAQAQTRIQRDRRHDIVNVKQRDPDISYRLPGMRLGDLTGSSITYTRHRITVVARFRELSHRRHLFYLAVPMRYVDRAGRNQRTQPMVLVMQRNWDGQAFGAGTSGCRIAHRIDYRRDTIRMAFASSCIGSPRWVRPVVAFVSQRKGYDAVDLMPQQSLTHNRLRWGARVHRG
jgi:hypothetical protein